MKEFPQAPALRKIIGPSFILLGLGLGSGEIIMWPHLVSKYGLGIIWAAIFGIFLQFFINLEIERYTLLTGKSLFVGLKKIYPTFSPLWFIASTLIPWIWPGIIAYSGLLFVQAIGFGDYRILSVGLLILIGLIYTFGSKVYRVQELTNKLIIFLGLPFLIIITGLLVKPVDFISLGKGLIGLGNGYLFLPAGLSIASFLGAVVYSGAGGNLNLAQSFYIKDKGWGMAKYEEPLPGFFEKIKARINLKGHNFSPNKTNLLNFRIWWKKINIEHFFVFFFTGSFTIITLALLSFLITDSKPLNSGVNLLISESLYISNNINNIAGTLFLLIISLMLFGTQFSIYGSTSRIMAENFHLYLIKDCKYNLSRTFYFFLWIQILIASLILITGIGEPLLLITLSAVLNSLSMSIYSVLIIILNRKFQKPFKPSLLRTAFLIIASSFYTVFFILTVMQKFAL